MALLTCPECKKKISENAVSCPNCGFKLTPEMVVELKMDYEREFYESLEVEKPKAVVNKPKDDKSKMVLYKFFGFVFLVLVVVYFFKSNKSTTDIPNSLGVVKEYINLNPQYGVIESSNDMPDWANGERLQVETEKGNFLFYLNNNEVVGVDKYLENGGREKLFQKEIGQNQNDKQKSSNENLPKYKILFKVDLFSGAGKYGDVLISSYNKKTPNAEIESTLRRIIKIEGFVSAALYCTEDAYKANMSESFAKTHPNALKNGYLGQITESGIFKH